MLSGLLVRWLLIPYLLLIALLLGATAVFVAVRAEMGFGDSSAVLWFLVGCAAVGLAAAAMITVYFAREQTRQVAEIFASLAPMPVKNKIKLTDLLDSTAKSFSSLIAQASKDKSHLLAVLSGMSDGLIAIDAAQRVMLVNQAAEDLLGFGLSEAAGKPLYDAVAIPALLRAVHEVLLTGQQKVLQIGPLHDRHLELTLRRLTAADRAGGMVIVIHDITESRCYEELRKEFVANVSHELRTPLTVIKGFIETLRDGAIDDRPRAMEYLETMGRHSDQLANLVNDLLDLSRLDSGADRLTNEPVEIGGLLRRVQELMLASAEKKHQVLTLNVPANLPPITGNADYLQRAISNLVENAIKYTADAGRVTVTASQASGQVIIEVSDSGIGIPPDDLARIFERFYRVDRSRSRAMGGTGLGLSIVKHVVQNHGGAVEVASKLGEGSTFTVRLPIGAGEKNRISRDWLE